MSLNEQLIKIELQAAIDLYRRKKLNDAIVKLQTLTKEFPMSAKAWGYLGFLNREAKQPLAAERCFRKAVALSPKSERASIALFYTLWNLKRFTDALKEMGRFLTIGRPHAYLSMFLGQTEKRQRLRTNASIGSF